MPLSTKSSVYASSEIISGDFFCFIDWAIFSHFFKFLVIILLFLLKVGLLKNSYLSQFMYSGSVLR